MCPPMSDERIIEPKEKRCGTTKIDKYYRNNLNKTQN